MLKLFPSAFFPSWGNRQVTTRALAARLAAKKTSPSCRPGSMRMNGPSANGSAHSGRGSSKPACEARNEATTPSFSSGSTEHVA